jgi:DNA-binding Lrp family transcriptional regulator
MLAAKPAGPQTRVIRLGQDHAMSRPVATPLGAAADDRATLARQRLLGRLGVGLLLDLIDIARSGGDVLDTLLASVIIHANVAEIMGRADLQLVFADKDEMPPDEMRRPVTMHAIATSLALPFETVRRRVRNMVETGFCKAVDGGVIVPGAVLAAPQYTLGGFRGYERIRAFYYQLGDLGLLREVPPATVELAPGVFPIRAVARLVGTYVLRVIETLAPVGDLVDGLVWLEIYRSNVEHLPAELSEAPGAPPGPDDLAHDGLRRPAPVTALAARLGLPHETVRRRVTGMIARGACVRVHGGLIVPGEALARAEFAAVLGDNAANLTRLFGALSQLGVLQVWDSVRPEA